jgi:hypothetical protein
VSGLPGYGKGLTGWYVAVTLMTNKSLKDIRKSLMDRCNRVLLMYRKHCAPAVQQGQVSSWALLSNINR